ncbi:MAG TPA: Nif3-like dinuclear metal center hexameric protein, partial [Clostridia bacterium]|nr:Nif3-like dinuclear metal center hexameric protein [Clostridia bacterium]
KEVGIKKKELIERHNLVIIRIHDTWDIRPEFGMSDAWASFLGFGKRTALHKKGFQSRYDIEPTTVYELAVKIASKTAKIGEPMVQIIGDQNKIVSKVCLGPGYASHVQVGKELGCDINIMADDGSLFWKDIQSAVDMDYPIIRVNHGTSEESGTIRMAEYLNKNFEGINAVHMPIKPFFKMVGKR